ncbi:MAG: 50S ribosomal protein L10 [Clostridia bacterium]|nr:50S ribosomal protein L10 [Clostridia bacterium]
MSKEVLEAKKQIVEEFKEKYNKSKSVIFINYKGINVEQDTKLRKNFRENKVEYKIYKNRLIKIALDELGITNYDAKYLDGTTSVAFGEDEVGAATVLYKAIKDFNILETKFGIVNGEVVDAAQIEALSKIPSKEVLIAQLLGMLNAPVAALARVLDAIAKKDA